MVSPISNKSLITNVLSNIGRVNSKIGSSIGRIASGKGILKGSDNAAGLAISARLNSDISAFKKGVENISQGVSLTRVAEGGLQSISNILTEAKSLAVQASNGTLNDNQRATIQAQFDSMVSEIDRIAEGTEFNGKKLLNGTLDQNAPAVNIQVGKDNNASSKVNLNVVPKTDAESLGLNDIDLSNQTSAQNALGSLDGAIESVVAVRGELGSIQKRLASVASTQNIAIEELTKATSTIADADIAKEVSRLRQSQVQLNTALQGLKMSQFSQKNIGSLLNIIS